MVIDSTDKKRLPLIKNELHHMLASDDLSKASVLIFANKQVRKIIYFRGLFLKVVK